MAKTKRDQDLAKRMHASGIRKPTAELTRKQNAAKRSASAQKAARTRAKSRG